MPTHPVSTDPAPVLVFPYTVLVSKILDDLRKKADELQDDNWLYLDVPLPGK